MNNRQAALIAASNLYPAAYKVGKFTAFTSDDVLDLVYEKSDAIKAWLDHEDELDIRDADAVKDTLNPDGVDI